MVMLLLLLLLVAEGQTRQDSWASAGWYVFSGQPRQAEDTTSKYMPEAQFTK
jgi:hypothetical protein